jgi:hypothetical protein
VWTKGSSLRVFPFYFDAPGAEFDIVQGILFFELDITDWLWAITNSLWVLDKSFFFDQTGPSRPAAALT